MDTVETVPEINWKQGSVTICNGRIYVSPNCNRLHALLPEPSTSLTSPFVNRGLNQLTVHDFKQPVWWNNSWGWMGFMPLSPSFLANPFASLAWKPKITTTDVSKLDGSLEQRYELPYKSSYAWKQAEDRIVEACSIIRLSHTIPGELPPRPSDLGFLGHHASHNIAKRQAEISRDWFVLWIGLLSYLTIMAQAHPRYALPNPSDRHTVKWYSCLQERNFPPSWLEGLAKSSVCRFDEDTPRAGVVMRLSDTSANHRPSVAWFMKHKIPVWFVLDAQEELWIRGQHHLSKLLPPQTMINDALSQYFNGLSTEVKTVVMIYYLNTTFKDVTSAMQKVLRVNDLTDQTLHHCLQVITPKELEKMPQLATAQDGETVLKHLRHQLAFHEATLRLKSREIHYPWPQMLDTDDFQDAKLYKTWQEFFDQRAKRHVELERTEDDRNRQCRLARDKNRARKRCVVYQWRQVVSGGKIFYARICISHKRQEQVLNSFLRKDASTRKFNAFTDPPEWDLYEHFVKIGPATNLDPESEVSDSDDIEFESPRPSRFPVNTNFDAPPSYQSTPIHAPEFYGPHNFTPQSPPPDADPLEHPTPSLQLLRVLSCSVAEVQLQPALHEQSRRRSSRSGTKPSTRPAMLTPTPALMLVDNLDVQSRFRHASLDPTIDIELPDGEIGWNQCMKVIGCHSTIDSGTIIGHDQRGIQHFISQLLRDPTAVDPDLDDLKVANRSYLAGLYPIKEKVVRIHSGLYVFQEPQSSSIDWCLGVTTAAAALLVVRLILQNRNHTLMTLTEPLLQMHVPFHTLVLLSKADAPLRQRKSLKADMSEYLYPIDYEFSSADYDDYTTLLQDFLLRPHGRAALLNGGLVARIAQQYLGFDVVAEGPSSEVRQHLTGNILDSNQNGFKYMDDCLDDQDIEILIGAYHMKTKQANQTTVVSWLPPPSAFYEQTKSNYWTYWSPDDDKILALILDDISAGIGKPKSKRDWRKWVRGRRGPAAAPTPIFYNNLVERSESFMCSVFDDAD